MIIIAVEEDKKQGYAMGATDCLDKTIERHQLIAILEKYHIGDSSQNLIMVVDDDDMIRASIASVLETEGWRVFLAEDGQVALEHLDDKKPSLILLDLNMPVMDGFEFLTRLHKNDKWQATPVVILTARSLSAEEHANLNRHVETIFPKESLKPNEFIEHIHQLIASTSSRSEQEKEAEKMVSFLKNVNNSFHSVLKKGNN